MFLSLLLLLRNATRVHSLRKGKSMCGVWVCECQRRGERERERAETRPVFKLLKKFTRFVSHRNVSLMCFGIYERVQQILRMQHKRQLFRDVGKFAKLKIVRYTRHRYLLTKYSVYFTCFLRRHRLLSHTRPLCTRSCALFIDICWENKVLVM